MKKLTDYLLCFIPLILALTIQIIVRFFGNKFTGNSDEFYDFISILAATICISMFSFWLIKLGYSKLNIFNKSLSLNRIIMLMILGIALQMLVTLFLVYLSGANQSNSKVSEYHIRAITMVFEVIFAPISDEVIFRGVMLTMSLKQMPTTLAIILQAVAFGVYHGNIIQGIYAFTLGIIFGYIMIWFNNIGLCIFLHMVINLSGNLIYLLPRNSINYGIYFVFISLSIIIFIMILLKKSSIRDVSINNKFV